jgi:hypothetical protein
MSEWCFSPKPLAFPWGLLLSNADVNGHDCRHVYHLIEHVLFKVGWRTVPKSRDMEGLNQLETLLSLLPHAVGKNFSQLVLQSALCIRIYTGSKTGTAKNSEKQDWLFFAHLLRLGTQGKWNGWKQWGYMIDITIEKPFCSSRIYNFIDLGVDIGVIENNRLRLVVDVGLSVVVGGTSALLVRSLRIVSESCFPQSF